MVRRRDKSSPTRMVVNGRVLTLAALVCGVTGAVLPSPAWAAGPAIGRRPGVLTGDGHGASFNAWVNAGNGRDNKIYSTILSPTVNRGLQQVANTNVSGNTNTQFGFCWKRHRTCNISQILRSNG
jgi:hypothetical protein